ncbi:hypothetical protein K474DRAFT_1771080 [Panus rudis PR-1116 ss-1]|nr:hypothetical protein K474DRAFT_1771080 [Panus rudis PR-1116 ss-1]
MLVDPSNKLDDSVLLSILRIRKDIRYSDVAVTSWLLFDWFIRLDDEIQLVWTSANTPPKYFYFISRYFGLVTQIIYCLEVIPVYCQAYLAFRAFSYYVLHLSVEFTLMLRIYALWNRRKRVAFFLLFTFFIEQTVNLVLLAMAEASWSKSIVPFPRHWPLKGCIVYSHPSFFRACWIPILLFETLLFIMNTIKCISLRPLTNTPLIIRVLRDGTIYYMITCAVLLLRTVAQYRPDWISTDISDTFMTATFSISGSHLMLSIRSLVAARDQQTLTMPQISVDEGRSSARTDSKDVETSNPADGSYRTHIDSQSRHSYPPNHSTGMSRVSSESHKQADEESLRQVQPQRGRGNRSSSAISRRIQNHWLDDWSVH